MDEGLLLKVKSHDVDAYNNLYNLYSKKVYKTALMIINDTDAAEDILQDVFIQIYLKIFTLKSFEAFEFWLYRITVNCCMKYFKRIKRFGIMVDESGYYKEQEEDISFLPEERVIWRELSERVWAEIAALPPHHRIPIILHYYNEMNIKEIAAVMNCSEGTVKSRLYYSKKYLKKCLEKTDK